MDSLLAHPAVPWIILGIVCWIIEVAVPAFVFLFLGAAALVAALVALGFPPVAQLFAFAISLALSLGLLRPRLVHRLQSKQHLPSRPQMLLGKVGPVTERIDPVGGPGRVSIEGQDWAATAGEALEVGTLVEVQSSDGIILIVRRK